MTRIYYTHSGILSDGAGAIRLQKWLAVVEKP